MSDFANPWTVCRLPGSSIHGILQARILEWVASPRDLPNPGVREPRSPTLQVISLPAEPPEKQNSDFMTIINFNINAVLQKDKQQENVIKNLKIM